MEIDNFSVQRLFQTSWICQTKWDYTPGIYECGFVPYHADFFGDKSVTWVYNPVIGRLKDLYDSGSAF